MPFARPMAAAWLLMLVPALAVAQASSPASTPPNLPDPSDPAAVVPAMADVAPMSGYLPYQSPTVTPWRQSNAAVAPVQGAHSHGDAHAGHRMPRNAAPQPASSASAPLPSAPAPEGDHDHSAH
ncbi:hypothetical protein [Cupriavidus pauculus]|uniref:hypothetical protein n=1 Tax=Cupriavidus pauculus TaxID=82633 RepID=UPI001FD1E2DD|nr:hypothetical protein [Cupriavidus pauculus]